MNFEQFIQDLKTEASTVPSSEKITAVEEDQFYKKSNKEDLRGKRQDRKERKRYAKSIFRFIKIWAYVVIIIFVAEGKGYVKFDNSVIITLLTTTTANVLALFAIVANYLFYRKDK